MILLAAILTLTLLLPLPGTARIIDVPDDFELIQTAIEESSDGDTVLIAPGVYVENNINFLGRDITVGSFYVLAGDEDFISETIIDGDAGNRIFIMRNGETENAILTGLTIRNGSTTYGGAVYIRNTSPVLSHLIIHDNAASEYGGGIYVTTRGGPTLINLTVYNNTAESDYGGIRVWNEATANIVNCVFYSNEPAALPADMNVTFSDMETGYAGEGNIDSDPRFIDADNGDFNLSDNSPCIDAGDPDSPEDPDGTRADMGALSFSHQPQILVNPFEVEFDTVRVGIESVVNLTITNIGALPLTVEPLQLIPDEGFFSIDAPGEAVELGEDEELVVPVTFRPDEEREYEALVRVVSNDPENDLIDVPLTGSGLPPIPHIEVQPRFIDFGAVDLHRLAAEDFAVSNTGAADLHVENVSIAGEDVDDFSVNFGGAFDLGAGEAVQLTVSYQPTDYGARRLTILIESNDPFEGEINVIVSGEGILPEPHFEFTDNTGVNHSLLVLEALLGEDQLGEGSQIGVFSPNGLCCGANYWMGDRVGIAAWGDNEMTEAVDGLRDGEEMSFRYWDVFTREEVGATAEFEEGDEVYRDNGISVLSLTSEGGVLPDRFMLYLNSGWDLISTPIDPLERNHMELWSPLVDAGHLEIVKDYLGRFYSVEFGFSNLPQYDVGQGFQVKMSDADSMIFRGDLVEEDTPIPIATGWGMVAYFPEQRIGPIAAFENIVDVLILAKDGQGRFYRPDWGFENIGLMRRGQGYQVNVTEDVDLVWNVPDRAAMMGSGGRPQPEHFRAPAPTGSNMSVLITQAPDWQGAYELAAISSGGLCVGAVVIDGEGPWGMAVWGDDPTTERVEAALDGESLTFKAWRGREEQAISALWSRGDGRYETDGFIAVSIDGIDLLPPTEFRLDDPYPNPFNGRVKLGFELPNESEVRLEILDVSGRVVTTLATGTRPSGRYGLKWNADGFPAGLYLARISTPQEIRTAKMMLVK